MIALVEKTHTFAAVDGRIEKRFLGIDDFEFQQAQDLRIMRDERLFVEGGYKSFEQYCEQRLVRWGGYRRVNQLIGAAMVVDTLKDTEFDGLITRESHARPLLRLVKKPEKLREAVALACQESPAPIAATFKKAVEAIAPREQKSKSPGVTTTGGTPARHSSQEQLFPEGTKIRIAAQSHPDFDAVGVVVSCAGNGLHIIELDDERRVKAYESELKDYNGVPTVRTPAPRTYTEEELQAAIARAIEEAQLGKLSEFREKAEAGVAEDLKAARAIASAKSLEIAKLQQKVDELESLRTLEVENKILKQEVESLKSAIRDAAINRWDNTFTQEAQKVLNANTIKVVENLEPDLHLRQMAHTAPERDPRGTINLLGLSLEAMSNGHPRFAAELRKAAAIVLGVDETSLSAKRQQLEQLGEAIASIKSVLAQPGVTWAEFTEVGDRYELIKQEIWLKLTPEEKELVNQLSAEFYVVGRVAWSQSLGKKIKIEKIINKTAQVAIAESAETKILPFADIKPVKDADFPEPPAIQINSRVSGSDKYTELYLKKGSVIQEFDDGSVLVHWDDCDRPLLSHRYEHKELRVI